MPNLGAIDTPVEQIPQPVRADDNGGNSIRRNTVYAVLGNGFLNLSRLAVLVLMAKAAGRYEELGAEIQGIYTFTLTALASPIILFCSLELRTAFVADTHSEFTYGTYQALRNVGLFVAAVAMFAVVLFQNRADLYLPLVWLMLAACAGKLVFQTAEVCWGVFQRRERLGLMAISNTIRGVLILFPFVVAYRWLPAFGVVDLAGADEAQMRPLLLKLTAGAVTAYALAWTAVWWFFERRLVMKPGDVNLSWNWPAVGRLAKKTLPLGLVFLLIHLADTVTQGFIKKAGADSGWADVGYFGTMKYITLVTMFIVVQVNTAAGNRLAIAYRTDLRAFLRIGLKVTGIALGIGFAFIGAVFFHGEWFLRIVYSPEHAKHYPEFMILIVAQSVTLLAAVFGTVTTYMRQFWIQVPVHLAVLLATTLAAWWFIRPENPVHGGAITDLIRSSVQAALYLGCVLIGIRFRNRLATQKITTVAKITGAEPDA